MQKLALGIWWRNTDTCSWYQIIESSSSQHQAIRAVWLGNPTKQWVLFKAHITIFYLILSCYVKTLVCSSKHWVFTGIMTLCCFSVIKILYSLYSLFNNSLLSATVTVRFFSLCAESHCVEDESSTKLKAMQSELFILWYCDKLIQT